MQIVTNFQVKDDVRWSLQERELAKTDSGRQMLDYIRTLLVGAERAIDEGSSVSDAFGNSLVRVEEEKGNASLNAVGRILIITCWHWKHGDDLFKDFSMLEKKVFSSAAVSHIEEMQEKAKNLGSNESN